MKLQLLIAIVVVYICTVCSVFAGEQQAVQLHSDILSKKRAACKMIKMCGNLVSMDCGAALDGPHYYFNNLDGQLLMACGGRCMNPDPTNSKDCKQCPPKQWQQCKSKNKVILLSKPITQ